MNMTPTEYVRELRYQSSLRLATYEHDPEARAAAYHRGALIGLTPGEVEAHLTALELVPELEREIDAACVARADPETYMPRADLLEHLLQNPHVNAARRT